MILFKRREAKTKKNAILLVETRRIQEVTNLQAKQESMVKTSLDNILNGQRLIIVREVNGQRRMIIGVCL